MEKRKDSRQAVLDAASRLFHMYGYDGTSVRAIASEAGVNVALISYYFGGKKALLEQLMEHFLNGYILEIEAFLKKREASVIFLDDIVQLAECLLVYQAHHFYMARFVFREITLDSMLTREIMTTYLMKEKYLLEAIFQQVGLVGLDPHYSLDFLIMQFRDMVMLPYSQPQYIRKVYGLQPTQSTFLSHYIKHVRLWVRGLDATATRKPKLII
ncbi:forespore capture DNA-binding protein RefZ [Pullulanibacillus sp. KACC 23026]|uniref:forespore capture DNA-binding protein RefZ n=1 Tax=Pullulanibacillus sp. KACC 23026 TaxID=3028315 RepID=UPI0023B1C35B|nr:forespore capture DNA-binding protein RefZ [Pullulanibacillus sp. KACC 23026]WEG13874.1 forespore capture DNA-binding protein RefZ [Pullulanibacillus sp. KACC 23026]